MDLIALNSVKLIDVWFTVRHVILVSTSLEPRRRIPKCPPCDVCDFPCQTQPLVLSWQSHCERVDRICSNTSDSGDLSFDHLMSELHKTFAKSKLAKLPPDVPMYDETLDETRDEEGSSASSASSTGTLVPSPTHHLFARRSQGSVSSFYLIPIMEHLVSYTLFVRCSGLSFPINSISDPRNHWHGRISLPKNCSCPRKLTTSTSFIIST